MGLFGPSKKFSRMQTEEERYAASGAFQQTEQVTRNKSFDRTSRARRQTRQEQEQAATQERRQQVTRPGTLHLQGGTAVLSDGWQFATDKLPAGNLNGLKVDGSTLGDLSIKDLHDLATNHGPNCRCRLSS
ncbi:hypothetical protein [Streptomyces drozdowiczii]|uniref:Uncharacterized protein n=1 Tax=Streptomyces drozdowiczii TaxID=202862 RepID=A0ABY6Q112_9ACTN|nr:hypothetical protein [Streptomyces drozdowiczii]MCX0247973.1 hypothetical protein [Streptomyces drozdowiczii]UZK58235.1 hypothetical protein NEH16_32875 [Streptomyces drozdowiczii]